MQTYYVTLDLSTPQDPKPLDASKYERPKPNKKDEENEALEDIAKRLNVDPKLNKIWVNEGLKQGSRNASKMMRNNNHKNKGKEKKKGSADKEDEAQDGVESGENDMESEEDDLTANAVDQGLKKKSTKSLAKALAASAEPEEKTEKPRVVQILDLHHKHPIVSYGGQVFACEWTRNVGTELLFIEHDRLNPLPVLRSLHDGVDLLAASSIRISSKPVELERKINAPSLSTSANNGGWAPEPVLSEREKRLQQKDFLSQLNGIKRDRGEEDGVTINTKKLKSEKEWREEWSKKRNVEKTRLKRIIKAAKDMKAVEEAELRLKVIEEEDVRRKGRAPKPKYNAGRKKKIRSDVPATPTPTTRSRTPNTGRSSIAQITETPEVHTPSQKWVDDGEDGMYGDDMAEDDLYDEDTPLEDHAQMDDTWE